MEIESSRSGRIFWMILGLVLAGSFLGLDVLATLRPGPVPILWISSLFPIGMGIAAVLWLGRPAWIRVGATELSYVPPLGASRTFPRDSIKSIIRVPSSRGGSTIQFRDQDNRNLVRIEQGFARQDMENLAQFLGANLRWDANWQNTRVPGMGADEASREQALQQLLASMTPEQRAWAEKHMKKPEERG